MADIELVIKMPEKMYHMINAGFYDYGDMNIIIQNGTPLPKGHGRLIDADDIPNQTELKGFLQQDDAHLVTIQRVKEALDEASTIIEADTADSEE